MGTALACYRRALNCQKRLETLAPAFFDSAVVDREARRRKAQREWMASWEPAIAAAYGTAPKPPDPRDELPPLPPLRTQKVVNREIAGYRLWFNLGHNALERHKARRPHALVDLGRIARMIEIAFDFARMAAGMDSKIEEENISDYSKFQADFERAYGRSSQAATSTAGPPHEQLTKPQGAPPCAEQLPPAVTPDAPASKPEVPPNPAPSQATSGPASNSHRRRDAWASYSRHLRNLKA